jgi:phosphatidate cytidylyltransferase
MIALFDHQTSVLAGGILVFLALSTVIGFILAKGSVRQPVPPAIINLNARIRAWWVMLVVFLAAVATGPPGVYSLFGLISFWALREFITLTPTRRGDHRALFWAFFVILPLHYYILAISWYELFVIFIPVYAFLFLSMRAAVAGDCEQFLGRTSNIQWALMICVYCLSYAPALLNLDIPGYQGGNVSLLFWLVLVVEMNDVLQYIWGKLLGRHPIAPTVSPNKTWEGFLGGTASAVLLGAILHWATPFNFLQAAGMALIVTLAGFAGGLTMSAIKRDVGIKDFGDIIAGHGGVLDRLDSLCFAAPIFFHLTRFYFAA